MPMPISGLVGMPTVPGSGQQQLRLDPLNATVVTEANGKYYEAVRNGLLKTATTPAAGVALVSYGSTASGFVLYNPPGSGFKAELVRMTLGYVSGANTPGSVCYATNILPTGTAPTGTAATVLSNNIGQSGAAAQTAMQPLYTATVVALQLFETTGMSTYTAVATTATTPFTFRDDIDGRIVVGPGATFSIAGSVAAFGTFIASLSWIELPIAA